MPEGDTVHLVARRLDRALAGSVLTRTDLRVPRHATVDLSGRELESVEAFGKHIMMRVSPDTTIHTHLKMEGSWHLYRHGQRLRGPAFQVRVVLETDRWVAVGFQLGAVDVIPTSDEETIVGHLGPDPLRSEWDASEAEHRMTAAGDRAISDVLLDQRVIAGIGNVYKSEICFLSGIDPWTPVADVDVSAIVNLAARLMVANRDRGDQMTTGIDRPGEKHWVYGRGGRPCRRCGTRVERRQGADERVTYWCPSCQVRGGVGVGRDMPYSGSTPTRK